MESFVEDSTTSNASTMCLTDHGKRNGNHSLTGLSPPSSPDKAITRPTGSFTHVNHDAENRTANQVNATFMSLSSEIDQDQQEQRCAINQESEVSRGPAPGSAKARAEAMHVACKALLLLVRLRGKHIQVRGNSASITLYNFELICLFQCWI